jgi:putative ABC transport system permease protein
MTKAHGASVWQMVHLLLMSFIRIFLIAAVIVVPINYFILQDWLSNFRYQTTLGIFVFGASLSLILLITILTVGYETIKAVADPVKSLRYE